ERKAHAQEIDLSCVRSDICRRCCVRAGDLRNQSGRQGRQGARWRRKDLIHEEMHGRHLRNQSSEPGWQTALGCSKNQFHEEVRKGRLSRLANTETTSQVTRAR